MKVLVSILILFWAARVEAQSPQGIPYQAIARNASGVAIANTAVKVRFSIRDSIATGAIKYQETHNPTTSALGLFSVNVGMGTVVSGTFSGINWGKNAKFLQVELNTTGGTTYTDLGTTQMMSVPYAFISEQTKNNFIHNVGDHYQGGIIVYVEKNSLGDEHGLILSPTEVVTIATNSTKKWSDGFSSTITAISDWDGSLNSNLIISQGGHTTSAALSCLEYQNPDLGTGVFSDWYLPSTGEITFVFDNLFQVQRALSKVPGASILESKYGYWTSCEANTSQAWYYSMSQAGVSRGLMIYNKSFGAKIRAIRMF